MKTMNQTQVAAKDNRAAIAEQRSQIIDVIGQFLANEFNTSVGEFSKPNLILTVAGQQFAVTVSAREKALSLDGATATFTPEA